MKNFNHEELIFLFKEKKWDLLEDVIKEYTTILMKGAISLGFRGSDAEDLVQNTWSTFFEVLLNFKGNSQLKTFLYGILINKAREKKRENVRIDLHEPIDTVMEERFNTNGSWAKPPEGPEFLINATQSLDLIYECMEKLSFAQKTAFYLWEIEGNETLEICKILEVTSTNLGVLLFRAKNRLRECIEKKAKRL